MTGLVGVFVNGSEIVSECRQLTFSILVECTTGLVLCGSMVNEMSWLKE